VSLAIDCVLIDCNDLDRMSGFWRSALNLKHVWTGPSGGYLLVEERGATRLGLMPSDEHKRGKYRVHLDLRPDDQAVEIRRLEELGLHGSTSISEISPESLWRIQKEMSFACCDRDDHHTDPANGHRGVTFTFCLRSVGWVARLSYPNSLSGRHECKRLVAMMEHPRPSAGLKSEWNR
jgi:hypothetical protein